jgi:hypothetical protein
MLRSPWFWFFVALVIFAPAAIATIFGAIVPLVEAFFHNLGTVAHSGSGSGG